MQQNAQTMHNLAFLSHSCKGELSLSGSAAGTTIKHSDGQLEYYEDPESSLLRTPQSWLMFESGA